ncbi:MAG: hypothetical protein E7566_01545 [Ruminococcaceae bacterium]|nr:hypothetical protein [Oscillospiraceae bacterium]
MEEKKKLKKGSTPDALLLMFVYWLFLLPFLCVGYVWHLIQDDNFLKIAGMVFLVIALVIFYFGIKAMCADKETSPTIVKRIIHTILFIVLTLVLFFSILRIFGISVGDKEYYSTRTSSSETSLVTCSSCNERFKDHSANGKSIRNTSMCENCYGDFKWRQEAQEYIDNLPQ